MGETERFMPTHIVAAAGIEIEVGEVFCISSNTCKYPGYNGIKEVPTKIMLDFICHAKEGTPRPSEENTVSAYFQRDMVLELIQSPPYIERFKAFMDYKGRPTYLEYVTKPDFRLKIKRLI